MRALSILVLAACSSSSPPAPVAPPPPVVAAAPADAAVPEAPRPPRARREKATVWVGIRVDADRRITQLISGAPGERHGLVLGDRVVSVDGTAVANGAEFAREMAAKGEGATVAIAIERNGSAQTVSVPVEPRPASIAQHALLGKPAPAFAAASLAGPFSSALADHKGQVVIVDFWATWCGPCTITIPKLNELHDKHAAAGLRIIGLSNEEPPLIKKFVADRGMRYAIGHDPDDKIAKEFLREGLPMFVVIDRGGTVRHIVNGADVDGIEAAVTAVLAKP